MSRLLYIPKLLKFTDIKFGLLYSTPTLTATGANSIISSDDWVVPTFNQLYTLYTTVVGSSTGGGKLKETGTTYFSTPNTGATNEYGFNGRGAGTRAYDGVFSNYRIWMILGTKDGRTMNFQIRYNSAAISFNTSSAYAFTVRLLYVGSGSPTEYVGNDGKKYRTVKIGNQIWMTENLNVDHFRNGDPIPEVKSVVVFAD